MTPFLDLGIGEGMNAAKSIIEWTPAQLHAQREACQIEPCQIIDVRGADEFEGPLSHIEGSELKTLGPDLETYLKTNLQDASAHKPLVFVCRSGVRSFHAAQQAQNLGWKQAINLKGGMLAWNEAALPTRARPT